ncbi:MAG: hypothetical protein ACOYKE_03370 [Ferruginibacter sp.]
MLKFHEIKIGDYLMAENEGDIRKGEVTNLNRNEHQVCLDTGVQEFWFETDQLTGIPLSDDELAKLQFLHETNEDGTVKYKKGAFRLQLSKAGDFTTMEIWYRDERRHITHALMVHELQNHYHDMTKVHLTDEVFA